MKAIPMRLPILLFLGAVGLCVLLLTSCARSTGLWTIDRALWLPAPPADLHGSPIP